MSLFSPLENEDLVTIDTSAISYLNCITKNDNILEETLIEMVRQFECIWNTKSKANKNINAKQNAWKVISDNMGNDIEFLKRLWKNLRDNMSKNLKKREDAMKSGASAADVNKTHEEV